MTSAEFNALYIEARDRLPGLTRETMKQILDAYITAGKLASSAVKGAQLLGRSDLTIESWQAIEAQLAAGAQNIMAAINDGVYSAVANSTEFTSGINERYINEAVISAGAGGSITTAGVAAVYRSINDTVIASIANRIYSDGYAFSTRVWRAGLSYQEQIRRVLLAGLAQGRDPIKLAEDLSVYIRDGKIALVQRYGKLVRGTGSLIKRISNRVDWRALRLVVSELYAGLQDAARLQGHANPAGLDVYDWILERGRQDWDCACPDIASGSPYRYEAVPGYPHPRCRCRIVVRLRPHREFVDDLKKWVNFESVDYLDEWYAEFGFMLK